MSPGNWCRKTACGIVDMTLTRIFGVVAGDWILIFVGQG
jgi:hypothetical protein